jgi:tRNA (adenine57-N1/adenine58-N1)-methyltransferase
MARAGDLAQLISAQNKRFIVRLNPGGELQTHRGILKFDDLIGLPWGTRVLSHLGSPFTLLQPSTVDLLQEMRRSTQIMYAKDIGYILLMLSVTPGVHVVEAGTGSGALTTALAMAVGPQGHVTTYEVRPEMQRLAIKNTTALGLTDRVTFKQRDIAAGFDETGVDSLFLDVPNPYDYLDQVHQALKPGGFFGTILPTTNQVSLTLNALHRARFAFVEVCEIMLRFYKPHPTRLRPTDRMVAHTGFLVFGRPVNDLSLFEAEERPAVASEPEAGPDSAEAEPPVEPEAATAE